VLNGNLVRLGEPRDLIRDGANDLTFAFRYTETYPEPPDGDGDHGSQTADRGLRITLSEPRRGGRFTVTELSFWRDGTRLLSALRPRRAAVPAHRPNEVLLRVDEAAAHGLPARSYIAVSGLRPVRIVYRPHQRALRKSFDRLLAGLSDRPIIAAGELIPVIARADSSLAEGLRNARHLPRDEMIKELVRFAASNGEELYEAYVAAEAPQGWATESISLMPERGTLRDEDPKVLAMHLLARDLARAREQAGRLANAVRYLGPLRDEPRVTYPLGHTISALPVGERGEFTAAYLLENQNVRLTFTDPRGESRSDSLSAAVSAWCNHLGIAERITVTGKGKLGHQVALQIAGTARDPTAVGVGASQLLPVVVLVLGAPKGSVVLLEQPELHLHPKVQSRLADFFASARPDIRLVIETHSEYLLTRLRLRVAQGTLSPAEISVLFAWQTRQLNGNHGPAYSDYRELSVDELGNFDIWPDDFFDSLDLESVELAKAVTKRVHERHSAPDK
jgi:hypothetical protein